MKIFSRAVPGYSLLCITYKRGYLVLFSFAQKAKKETIHVIPEREKFLFAGNI